LPDPHFFVIFQAFQDSPRVLNKFHSFQIPKWWNGTKSYSFGPLFIASWAPCLKPCFLLNIKFFDCILLLSTVLKNFAQSILKFIFDYYFFGDRIHLLVQKSITKKLLKILPIAYLYLKFSGNFGNVRPCPNTH
jgi:hypothetical protein